MGGVQVKWSQSSMAVRNDVRNDVRNKISEHRPNTQRRESSDRSSGICIETEYGNFFQTKSILQV